MRCKEFEEEIYLYTELSASEKARLDDHVKQCKGCAELLKAVHGYQSTVNMIAEVKPRPANHSLLISNIMQAVAQSAPKQVEVNLFLESLFVKYSLVTVSLALTIFFATEQLTPDDGLDKRIPVAQTVTLSSSSVAKVIWNQKEMKSVSLYACIKSRDCNNAIIENFKQKKFNHENL